MATARGRASVAVTLVLCRNRCSAWTPDPVPTSSAVEIWWRRVAAIRVAEAAPIPMT